MCNLVTTEQLYTFTLSFVSTFLGFSEPTIELAGSGSTVADLTVTTTWVRFDEDEIPNVLGRSPTES
jgi:hypothetical protein